MNIQLKELELNPGFEKREFILKIQKENFKISKNETFDKKL